MRAKIYKFVFIYVILGNIICALFPKLGKIVSDVYYSMPNSILRFLHLFIWLPIGLLIMISAFEAEDFD